MNQRQRRHGGRIGAQDPWAERETEAVREGQQRLALGLVEPTFGPDHDGDGRCGEPGVALRAAQGRDRIRDLSILVAEHHQPARVPICQQGLETLRPSHVRYRQDAALLGRLYGIGAHATLVDARRLSSAGQHGLEHSGPHLDRFLHHVVEPRVLEWREAKLRPGVRWLVARLLLGPERHGSFSTFQPTAPFAVPAVEGQHGVIVAEPQHVAQVMGLIPLQRHRVPETQRLVDEEARSREIVAGQGLCSMRSDPGSSGLRRPKAGCQAVDALKLPLFEGLPRNCSISLAAAGGSAATSRVFRMILRQTPHRKKAVVTGLLVVAALLGPTAAWADCNADLGALAVKRAAVNAALEANKKAHGGKIDPVAACPQLKALAAAQGAVVSYMTKNKDWCSLPDDLIAKTAGAQAQISGFAVKACGMIAKIKEMQAKAAQQQAAQAAQVPALKLPTGPL